MAAARVPAALAREWKAKLVESGHADIEYEDGSILGIAAQEAGRAPDIVEVDSTLEYYSRAAEYLHVHDWTGARLDRELWSLYSRGVPMRELSAEWGVPLTTVHRAIERMRVDCAQWWRESAAERDKPPSTKGRKRSSEPRRAQLMVRLTKRELEAIESAATRAGNRNPHRRRAWVRRVLLDVSGFTLGDVPPECDKQ